MKLNVYIDTAEFDEFIVCFNGVEKHCSLRKRNLQFDFQTRGMYQLEIRPNKKKIFDIESIMEKGMLVLGGYRHYRWEETISTYDLSLNIELYLEKDEQLNLKFSHISCDDEGCFFKPVFEVLEKDCIKDIVYIYDENPSYLENRFKTFYWFINSGIVFVEFFIALCAITPYQRSDYGASVMILLLLFVVIGRHIFIVKKESKKYKEMQQKLESIYQQEGKAIFNKVYRDKSYKLG